jgi:uncharacterized protein (AIM24 family)
MNHRIIGTTLPVLEFQLQPGESVVAVSGELSWMSHSIQLRTGAQHGGGGILGAFKRVAGGGSLFMTEYSAQGDPGILAFATRVPGHILPVEVRPGQVYMIHRHGFLCSTPGVDLSVGFQQSLGACSFRSPEFRGFGTCFLVVTVFFWQRLPGPVAFGFNHFPSQTLPTPSGPILAAQERQPPRPA